MSLFLRWSWLLGLALFAPISLPAGGAKSSSILFEVHRSYSSEPLFAGQNCVLKTSPLKYAPSLTQISNGTPLRVIRRWNNAQGQVWLQVQIANSELLSISDVPRRGWLNV